MYFEIHVLKCKFKQEKIIPYYQEIAQEICNRIKYGQYYDMDFNKIDEQAINSSAYFDNDINFQGYIRPLHYAALKGQVRIVEDLIRRGADPEKVVNGHNLITCLYYSDKAQLVNLLNYFFRTNKSEQSLENIRNKITTSINAAHTDGSTLLIKAIKDHRMDLVKALIMAIADIKDNNTLHLAISYHLSYDIIEQLIQKNANKEYKDEDRNTPLILAAKKGRKDIIKLLLEKGADKNAVNKDGINWESAYKKARTTQEKSKRLRCLIYADEWLIPIPFVASLYAIFGGIFTDNLFHNFKPSGWNISTIAASVVAVISFISMLVCHYVYNNSNADITPEILDLKKTPETKTSTGPTKQQASSTNNYQRKTRR